MAAEAPSRIRTVRSHPGAVINRAYIRKFFNLEDTGNEGKILDYILAHLILAEYKHSSFICRAGEKADAMYFIEDGMIAVIGKNEEVVNELQPGYYFGEYAALTGDKRMADICAKGQVKVYRLDKKILNNLIRVYPKIYAIFLQKVYNQATEQYRGLVRLLNQRRGLGSHRQKQVTLPELFVNYSLVCLVFVSVLIWGPRTLPFHPLWMCSPIVFLVMYMLITRRALETLVLSVLYIAVLLSRFNFIPYFTGHVTAALSGTSDLVLMVVLMGSLTRIFSSSGSINALKHIAKERIKTGKGTLFTACLAMIFISIDEYLMILINGACFSPLSDQKKIPREKSSLILGMFPMALCILNPLSITGIYLTGIIAGAGGSRNLFVQGLCFNFAAILAIVLLLLLIPEALPKTSFLKKAWARVRSGGPLWPEGTDNSGRSDGDAGNRGRVLNLALPILALIVSSVAAGTLREGSLSVDVLFGMVIALITAFLLYTFQRFMTPENFFDNIIYGIETMLAPVVMFIIGKCFAQGIEELGFSGWLNTTVNSMIGNQGWMLPAIIFGVCTVIGALFDNPWAMYSIGMPIAINLALTTGGPVNLYVGAVCAAGFIGNEIALGDIFFTGPMLGINPIAYYRTKLPYVLTICFLAFAGYAAVGWFLFR